MNKGKYLKDMNEMTKTRNRFLCSEKLEECGELRHHELIK